MTDEKIKVRFATDAECQEFLAQQRQQCRELENREFADEKIFKYTARTFWWGYLEKAQIAKPTIMTFQEFWDNPETYPRTIAADAAPVSLSRK